MGHFKAMLLALVFASNSLVLAQDVYEQYETLAMEITDGILDGELSPEEIQNKSKELIVLGYEILWAYSDANPECTEQTHQVQNEDPEMASASYEHLTEKYHDGVGLISPDDCYIPRSMVVHPYMGIALARDGFANVEEVDRAAQEYYEVALRARDLKDELQSAQ